MRTRRAAYAALAATLVLAAACSGGDDTAGDDDDGAAPTTTGDGPSDPGDCINVPMAVSSEKITLLTDLADSFNASAGAQLDGRCVFVAPAQRGVRAWPPPSSRRVGPTPTPTASRP